jgi:hypothetical protein
MYQLTIKCCLAAAVILGCILGVVKRGDATPNHIAPIEVTSASAINVSTADSLVSIANISVPDVFRISGERGQAATCDAIACQRFCNGTGWCEGTCIFNKCRCVIRKGPGGLCP